MLQQDLDRCHHQSLDTRKWISMGIEAANHSPITEKFNLGVIQV
jgi:hypothetical protein